jgi:acylphosphatase
MKLIRATVRIKGVVQGVNFRYFTQRTALEHNLTGCVRNLPNGDVEAIFEGRESDVRKVLFARPTEQRPRSPQQLHLVPVEGTRPGDGEVIARSRAYNDLSIAPTKSGAVVVWTADRRTWGMVITCPK